MTAKEPHLLRVDAAVGRWDLRLTGCVFKSQPVRFYVKGQLSLAPLRGR